MPTTNDSKRKSNNSSYRPYDLEARILQSFANFPGATNSAEGIAGTWLGGEEPERVSSALNCLLDAGAIGKLGWGESTIFFAFDPTVTSQLLQNGRA